MVELFPESVLHPGRRLVTKVCEGDGGRDVDGCEQPQGNDGDEAADGEDD